MAKLGHYNCHELFGLINWDGYASPTTGRTNGHYTANVKHGDKWFHMNDNKTKDEMLESWIQ